MSLLPARMHGQVKLIVSVSWRAEGIPAGQHGVWMEQVVERPYGREPAVGEWLDFGDLSLEVKEVVWAEDGCHLHLGDALGESNLQSLKEAGFREPAREVSGE